MNDRITDLLTEVADDDGRPLGFTTRDVVSRGAGARRRRAAVTTALPLALAAVAVTATVLVAGGGDDPGAVPYATDPAPASPTTSPTTSAAPAPVGYVAPTPGVGWTGTNTPMSSQDAEVYSRCTELEPAMLGWRFDAQVTDEHGTTATFVSDDHTRWRQCTLGTPGDQVSPAWPLDTSPVPEPWERPDSGVEFATLCAKDGPATCSDRLYTGALPLRFGVADVAVTTPSGARARVAVGVVTYVVRFVDDGESTSTPPIVATLSDADGATVVRYDYNELMR